jgi:zinc/manganese transport system substrate-binding protein
VRKGAPGYVDASAGIPRLEVPREQITGASGDIHVNGNPHYFYDPENGKIIAHNILEGLIRVSPSNKAYFQGNY